MITLEYGSPRNKHQRYLASCPVLEVSELQKATYEKLTETASDIVPFLRESLSRSIALAVARPGRPYAPLLPHLCPVAYTRTIRLKGSYSQMAHCGGRFWRRSPDASLSARLQLQEVGGSSFGLIQ